MSATGASGASGGNGHLGVDAGAEKTRERRQPVDPSWLEEVVPREQMVDWLVVWLGPDQQLLGRLRGCTEIELRAEMERGNPPRGTLWPVYIVSAAWIVANGALQRVQNLMHASQAVVPSARSIAPPMHGDLGLVHFASEYDEPSRASFCARARVAEQARSGIIIASPITR